MKHFTIPTVEKRTYHLLNAMDVLNIDETVYKLNTLFKHGSLPADKNTKIETKQVPIKVPEVPQPVFPPLEPIYPVHSQLSNKTQKSCFNNLPHMYVPELVPEPIQPIPEAPIEQPPIIFYDDFDFSQF